jgi:hypothetical protein
MIPLTIIVLAPPVRVSIVDVPVIVIAALLIIGPVPLYFPMKVPVISPWVLIALAKVLILPARPCCVTMTPPVCTVFDPASIRPTKFLAATLPVEMISVPVDVRGPTKFPDILDTVIELVNVFIDVATIDAAVTLILGIELE